VSDSFPVVLVDVMLTHTVLHHPDVDVEEAGVVLEELPLA